MSKERKTVSLDPEVAAYLDEPGRNASETVNQLVKRSMGTDKENVELLQLRLEQVRSEREMLESRLEKKRSQQERLEARIESIEEETDATLSDARKALDGTALDPENPAVQHWADKANMTPTELIDEL